MHQLVTEAGTVPEKASLEVTKGKPTSLKQLESTLEELPQSFDEHSVHTASQELRLDLLEQLYNQNPSQFRRACQSKSFDIYGYSTLPITKAIRTACHAKKGGDEKAREDIRIHIVDLLLLAGSPAEGQIVFAGWKGHSDLVYHLLEKHKVDVNGRVPMQHRNVEGTGNGETVLHGSLMGGNDDLVKTLIKNYNADINAVYKDDPNYEGETILHIACANGGLDMVQFLVERGADLEPRIDKSAIFFQRNPAGSHHNHLQISGTILTVCLPYLGLLFLF
jgi:ankyrin repeat protein